jgi:hypothetical protein
MNMAATIILAALAIGYAAANPSGMGGIPAIPSNAPADCTVTTQHDVGPSDPVFDAKLRAATERLCAALNKEGA